MERVQIVLGSAQPGKLMVVEIVGQRFPVLLSRPADGLRHIGPKETLPDGQVIGTGQRELFGELKNVAWRADAEEVARIDREWREAIENSTSEVLGREILRG